MAKVSIIVPVYKTERYLRECLESLVNQSLQDIEIIIVDDGSPDNSHRIIAEYARRYPCVHAYRIENSGQAVARNYGISKASGEFIAFVDSDDYVPRDVYQSLYARAKETDCDVIAGVLQSFNSKHRWIHEIQKKCFSADIHGVTIDEYENLILDGSPCNKLIRREFVSRHGIGFYEGLNWKEDWYFCMLLYFHGAKVSLSPQVVYCYRAREDLANPSATQTVRSFSAEKFQGMMDELDRVCLAERGQRIKIVKDAHLLQTLISYVRRYNADLHERDLDKVIQLMRTILTTSSEDVFKCLELFEEVSCRLILEGGDEAARRFLLEYTFAALLRAADTSSFELGQVQGLAKKLEVHLLQQERRVHNAELSNGNLKRQLEEIRRSNIWRATYPLRWSGHHVKSAASKLKQRSSRAVDRALVGVVQFLWAKVWKKWRDAPVIVVGERQRLSMEDNAYVFFSYVKNKYPGHQVYFVYEKGKVQPDSSLDQSCLLVYRSMKYWLVSALADCYVVTDCIRDIADSEFIKGISRFRHVVFLQHGIIGHRKLNNYYEKASCEGRKFFIDTFVVSSEFERELVASELGYKKEVLVSGLPRYDLLSESSTSPKRLLIAPTWRQWLRHEDEKTFLKSDYYRHWISLLSNPEFHQALKLLDIKAVFYPHFAMHRHLKCFDVGSADLSVADPAAVSLGQIIRDSNFLITDYSSIAFDFMYKRSPVIFYQFDSDRFHGDAGGPPPIGCEELVGDVVYGERELLSVAMDYFVTMRPKAEKLESSARYYAFRDGMNSERIYRHIMASVNQRS